MLARRARDRLLDGFVLRLARVRDADAYALRGGMLVRHWLPEAGRVVRDLDLVCALPYRPRDVRQRVAEILRVALGDGVDFEADRFRIDPVACGDHAMAVLFAAGRVDGELAEITVDVTFGLDVWPAAMRDVVTAERGVAPVWTCGHEMVVATKLAVIAELGAREWRAKDLADIWCALRRFSPARSLPAIGEAIERRSGDAAAGVAVLAAPWWRAPHAAMRWGRQVARQPYVPGELDAVLAEVRDALAPLAPKPPRSRSRAA